MVNSFVSLSSFIPLFSPPYSSTHPFFPLLVLFSMFRDISLSEMEYSQLLSRLDLTPTAIAVYFLSSVFDFHIEAGFARQANITTLTSISYPDHPPCRS